MKISLPFIPPLFLTSILLVGLQVVEAQDIVVPAANKAKTSPLVFNASTSKEGQAIYEKNCVSCHGNPGMGNNLKALNPPPDDLATDVVQNQTDGAIFYKISEGNPVMPKFKNTLTEDERWSLVSYIRSFNKKYIQPAPRNVAANLLSKAVSLDILYDLTTNQISFMVKAIRKNDTIQLKGTDCSLWVKRNFGRLQIGTTTKTNKLGIATFDFPQDLPGDKKGNIELIALINDNVYGEIMKSKTANIGVPTDKPSLTAKRAMWNVMWKAPVWLLLTFFSIVIGVWMTIAYIIYNMYMIKKISLNQQL